MRLLRASSLSSSSLLLLGRPAPRTILSSCYRARFFCSASTPTSKLSRTVEQFQYAAPLRGIPFDVLQLQLASINNQKDTSDATRFHIQRGNINYNLGRWEDAHKDFAQIISSSSTSTSEIDETIAKDISCLLQLKETDKAAEEVSKIKTPHIQWWMKAHMSFVSGAFTDAISHYSQAIESAPEPIFELYFNRGVVYTSVRKHEEALEDFTKALDISPENNSALRWRGEILAKLSRNELAISDLTAALESKEEDPMHTYQISYWLGMSNLNLNKAEEAIKYFNTIVDEIPSAKYQRARAFVLQDKFKEALQDLEDSSQLLEAGAIEKTDYYYLKGQCLYNTNEASKALEYLNLCDEANPRLKELNYTFLMLRGDCQFVLGKYSIALQNFKKAFELVPPQIAMRVPQSQPVVDLHMRIARCLVSLKNFKATGQELDKITPTKPTVEVCMQIGNLYLLIGQAEKAVKQYSKAIELSSGKNYSEYIARGIAYMALGAKKEKDSLADFLHAQSLDAENAKDATYYIGELYFHNKKYEQAKPHFEESLRTLKDNNEFTALSHYYLSGCYWNFNEQEKAIKSLDSAIEVKKDSKFLLQRAQYNEQLQKYDEAIADFSELLDISGDDADVYEQRARCYFNKRYFEKAIADISKALALKPNQHADWYYLRSKIYAELDAYPQATKDLDSAISLSPNDPQLYYLRSVCYHHSEQFDNSAQDCNTALRLYSTSSSSPSPSSPPPQLFITFGSALFQLGDYTESATQYNQVITEKNNNNNNKIDNDTLGEAHFGMGRSLLFGGNSEEAMSHFQLAIQLSPSTMAKLDILQNQLSQMNSE